MFEYDDKHRYNDRFSLDPTLIEGETWTVRKHHSIDKETITHDSSAWQREN